MSGVWQGGGGHQDRNLLDFNEITVDDNGRVLYGYSDGCVTVGCISGGAPNDFSAHMRVARQFGGKPILALFDPNPAEPVVPKPPCLSATRDCTASHLSWKAPDNGGADIVNYQIFRGTSPGTEALIGQTGVPRDSFNDTSADPLVAHYYYVVKAINATGTGPASNEVDLSAGAVAVDDVASTLENQSTIIAVLANDCGFAPLSVTQVSTPGHGTASINGNNTVTYTPAAGFFGLDHFTYTLHNGQGATTTGTVRITVNPLCSTVATGSFNEDFESGAPGWVVDTAENNVGPASPTWSPITDPNAQSASHSFFSDATTLDRKDDRLVAPAQKLSATSQLTFWHRYNFEDGYDGGVLEVSSDGGLTWVDLLLGGGSFVSGGYNGTISPSFGSRIAGRQAWTGGSPTAASDPMTEVVINLGAFAGLDRFVRFRLVTDPLAPGSLPGQGWWIDDVHFSNTLVEAPCTPTPQPTSTPSVSISGTVLYCSNPSPGPVPNVTFTLTGTSSSSTLSDSSGNYTFSSLPSGGNYTVMPTKADQLPGSTGSNINTVDVIAVQRHFLVLGTPLSGCRLTAADVNGDSAVNTVDAVAIQRFYLGLTTGIANVGKFSFSPTSRSYTTVLTNQSGQNYDTLIFGNVASRFVY